MTIMAYRAVAALLVVVSVLAQMTALDASPVGSDMASLQRQKRASLSDEAEKIIKQAHGLDTNNVGQLIDLVERQRADGCLKRVICELSKEPQAHGPEGSKFAQALLKYRKDPNQKVKTYLDAMSSGAKAKNIKECTELFKKCSHQLTEVIQVGNKLLKVK